jgi:hypothetical protein
MYRFYSRPEYEMPSYRRTKEGIKLIKKSRVTIVGEIKDDKLNIAVARCSAKDQFIKKTGRSIAEGRLAKGKILTSFTIDPLKKITTEEFITAAQGVAAYVIETKSLYNVSEDDILKWLEENIEFINVDFE